MGKFKFGSVSSKLLESAHDDLKKVMFEAIKLSPVDFGISESHRSTERQQLLYQLGKSKIDGVYKKGKHNSFPSLAVDVYAFVNGSASYNAHHVLVLAGAILATAEKLYQEKMISHRVRWGGNWDMDGEPVTDQSFDDLVHFELVV